MVENFPHKFIPGVPASQPHVPLDSTPLYINPPIFGGSATTFLIFFTAFHSGNTPPYLKGDRDFQGFEEGGSGFFSERGDTQVRGVPSCSYNI